MGSEAGCEREEEGTWWEGLESSRRPLGPSGSVASSQIRDGMVQVTVEGTDAARLGDGQRAHS